MDSYQPIFDAVRSRINGFDASALSDRIARQFDFSHHEEILYQEALNVANEKRRPSVLFRPSIQIDGNQWCALYGEDLQSGVAGFGDTPDKAMDNFDENWHKKLN